MNLIYSRIEKFIKACYRVIIISSAIILITLGIIGILLPVVPGIPFLILGLMLLYEDDVEKIKELKNKTFNFIKHLIIKKSN
jgi:uncharacterized membrane protein YbaN (DUF454 family)